MGTLQPTCPCEWLTAGSAAPRLVKRSEDCDTHGPQHGMPARYITNCGGCGENAMSPAPPGCHTHELAEWRWDKARSVWVFSTSDPKAPEIILSWPQK